MAFSAVLEQFITEAPFCVMVRGALEAVFTPAAIDALFEAHAVKQYEKELLFSTAVEVLAEVVCRIHPSVHAAYKQRKDRGQMPVSVRALYDKLAGVEPATARALVRHTAAAVRPVLAGLGVPRPQALAGYDLRLLDGNHLAGTEHR